MLPQERRGNRKRSSYFSALGLDHITHLQATALDKEEAGTFSILRTTAQLDPEKQISLIAVKWSNIYK